MLRPRVCRQASLALSKFVVGVETAPNQISWIVDASSGVLLVPFLVSLRRQALHIAPSRLWLRKAIWSYLLPEIKATRGWHRHLAVGGSVLMPDGDDSLTNVNVGP